MTKVLKTLAIVIAVLFALGIVLTANDFFFFGSSKVRTLFGTSADALAGDHPRGPDLSEPKPIDLDVLAKQADAGVIRGR